MLNRSALLVSPLQPYLIWAKSLDNSGLVPRPGDEKTVYLVPNAESEEDDEAVLRNVWSKVFDNELNQWHTDENAWPEKRSLSMFKKWFKIERHSVVEDLCTYPVEDEEY